MREVAAFRSTAPIRASQLDMPMYNKLLETVRISLNLADSTRSFTHNRIGAIFVEGEESFIELEHDQ